jgi:hypothetical protein
MSHRFLTACTSFAFFTGTVFAQGEFLYRGQGGFGASFDIMQGDHVMTYGLTAGYCVMGMFDIDFGYGWFDNSANASFSGSSVTPSLTIYFAKQVKDQPKPTIGLALAYTYLTFDVPGIKPRTEEAYLLGITIAHEIRNPSHIIIQPGVTVGYVMGYGEGISTTVSLATGGRFDGGKVIVFRPTLGLAGTVLSYGGGISIVL